MAKFALAKFTLFGSREAEHAARADSVAVLGLGRFGTSVAVELMKQGTDVLGVDNDREAVQRLDGRLTYVVAADVTDQEVLTQLAIPEFERVVVGISRNIAASILAASQLMRFGVREIWAAAASDQHGLILEQIGVHHVLYPETDMGRRLAHQVRGSLLDYLQVDDTFAVAETTPHAGLIGVPLDPAVVESVHGVMIIARRQAGGPWAFVGAGTVLRVRDTILFAGPHAKTDAFSQLR